MVNRLRASPHLVLPFGRLVEPSVHRVLRVGGHRTIPPPPPHHLRQDRSAELLPVPVYPPRLVHVVSLLGEGTNQPPSAARTGYSAGRAIASGGAGCSAGTPERIGTASFGPSSRPRRPQLAHRP